MQPGSTTILKSFTSSATLTLDVQEAVQWPHWLQASVTRIRAGAMRSLMAKMAP
ncbi:MAG: hypothetical protein IPK83_20495 [Planctomycetes bacterium]|nr:hypothetical protein [Planctomycetota bacterium]